MQTKSITSILAPAKINLTLHVTGKRADGYHLLDSLVVFAGVYDRITVQPSETLAITVTGPFSDGVPSDGRNLVLQAAALLRSARDVTTGAAITLEKNLPHAAGIGSGSSDAAAALALLAAHWGVAPLPADTPALANMGADIPVCVAGPGALRMQGIGDEVTSIAGVPDCAVVLVNPQVNVPTAAVFQQLAEYQNPGMTALPEASGFAHFVDWLHQQRNDLQDPAMTIAPEISAALDVLRGHSDVVWAGMSGSGATCVGLVRDPQQAQAVADAIMRMHPAWWVTSGVVLTGG
jgi:4-diphosphocytidyl-2-C-methyl-D-erythritol kinase